MAAADRLVPGRYRVRVRRCEFNGESFPELIPTLRVSANFFRLCGANAIIGRTFWRRTGDVPQAAKTAVLAYGFWQRHFGSDPQVIGRRIILNGNPYEVIGVIRDDLTDGQI